MNDACVGRSGTGPCEQRMAQGRPCQRVCRGLEPQPVAHRAHTGTCHPDLHQQPPLTIETNNGGIANRQLPWAVPRATVPAQFPFSHTSPEPHGCRASPQQEDRPQGPPPARRWPCPCQGQKPGQPAESQYFRQKRRAPHRITNRWGAGHEGVSRENQAGRQGRCRDQARLKTSDPLVPPKPKLFFSAKSIFMSRATFAQ